MNFSSNDKETISSTFAGFAPYDNPKYGVAVLIEHGKSGTAAAHLGGKILYKALALDATDQPID